ncbi:hypothetical protein R5H30_20335 [Sulfitobacter sp. D35]|uniref:hypothetical protein n=1 Tax=Sulfitobacter sp. D35 TaxID=3083252 RepID=UPI00296EF65B|nr:hypothetical protein [Sulfitobacter sp. D35]MDW4500348.1 hypothetical protein [Sulfitobacter sp. D35]
MSAAYNPFLPLSALPIVRSVFSGLAAGFIAARPAPRRARPMRFQPLDARQLDDIGFSRIEMGLIDSDATLHRRVIRLGA